MTDDVHIQVLIVSVFNFLLKLFYDFFPHIKIRNKAEQSKNLDGSSLPNEGLFLYLLFFVLSP